MRRLSGWARLWIVSAVLIWGGGGWWLGENLPKRHYPRTLFDYCVIDAQDRSRPMLDLEREAEIQNCEAAGSRHYLANKQAIDAAVAQRERNYQWRFWSRIGAVVAAPFVAGMAFWVLLFDRALGLARLLPSDNLGHPPDIVRTSSLGAPRPKLTGAKPKTTRAERTKTSCMTAAAPVRILIVMEDGWPGGRWSAGSPDLPDFVLICASRAELKAQLPAALEAHCRRPVAYRFLVPGALS